MIKKLGNKGLLLILLLVLAVFGVFRYISNKKGENTFKTSIIPKIDTNKLNGIAIFPRMEQTKKDGPWTKPLPYVFKKKGNIWYVSQGDVSSMADPRSSKYVISLLEQISPDRLASNDPKDWKEFNVNDTLGTRVALLYDKDTVADIIVGRFTYNMQKREPTCNLRINGQKEVYAVPGMLAMNIVNEFDNWRDKTIMPSDYASWTKLTFSYPADSGFVIMKDSNDRWIFGDKTLPDSLTAESIIKDIANQNYGAFINKFDSNGRQPLFTLRIEGREFKPVLIKAYPADTINRFAISSTINSGAFFSGGKAGGLFSKIFYSKSSFFKKEDKTAKPVKKGKK